MLRAYQQAAVDQCLADLKICDKTALVLPTGAGKTVCFIEIAKRFLEENNAKSVLILSHLSILTDQTYERFKQFEPTLYRGIMQGKRLPDPCAQIVIGTIQTLSREHKANTLKKRLLRDIGLIIVDEAHYLGTNSYDKCLSYFPKVKVLGCTATPIRKNQFMTNFFDKVSYSVSLQELIDQGYLVKPELIQIERESKELTDITAQIVKTYREKTPGESAIIYMRSVDDAKLIRNVMQESGIRAECLSFDMPKELRDEYIRDYARGDIKVLSCVSLLIQGFDCPRVSSIYLPYGTGSVTRYLQAIGRGLRTSPGSGKTTCRIFVYGDAPRIGAGFYERINNIALNQNGKIKEYSTYLEDYELNEYDTKSHAYEYCSLVVDTINKMKSLSLHSLESMLNHKEFPKRFMDKLSLVNERLPKSPLQRKSNAQPTDKQKHILINYDFTKSQVERLNRYEASTMISVILGNSQNSQFVINSGRFKNYHVSQLPWNYRKVVLEKFPSSHLAAMIHAWENRTKSA